MNKLKYNEKKLRECGFMVNGEILKSVSRDIVSNNLDCSNFVEFSELSSVKVLPYKIQKDLFDCLQR